FAGGAVAVVGEDLAEDGDAAGAVALVDRALVVLSPQLARALLDRVLDRVLGHVDALGVVDGVAEGKVAGRVASAVLGGDDDGAGGFAPELAAARVGLGFLVLDVFPGGMAGHGASLGSGNRSV